MVQSACLTPALRLRIHVRPGLVRFADDYLQKRRRELPAMLAAAQTGDFRVLRNWGQNLSGTGKVFGFAAVADSGRILEQAAKAGNATELQASLEKLARFLCSAEIVRS